MSVCPGCGRCRQCGQPAPIYPLPYYPTSPWWFTFTSPNTVQYGNPGDQWGSSGATVSLNPNPTQGSGGASVDPTL